MKLGWGDPGGVGSSIGLRERSVSGSLRSLFIGTVICRGDSFLFPVVDLLDGKAVLPNLGGSQTLDVGGEGGVRERGGDAFGTGGGGNVGKGKDIGTSVDGSSIGEMARSGCNSIGSGRGREGSPCKGPSLAVKGGNPGNGGIGVPVRGATTGDPVRGAAGGRLAAPPLPPPANITP